MPHQLGAIVRNAVTTPAIFLALWLGLVQRFPERFLDLGLGLALLWSLAARAGSTTTTRDVATPPFSPDLPHESTHAP
jgi:hypothetical protein